MKSMKACGFVILLVTFTYLSGMEYAVAKGPGQPGKVKKLSASIQDQAILLEWQPVAGCDGYRICHVQRGKGVQEVVWFDLDEDRRMFLFEDLTPGTRYSVWISALNGRREGAPSRRVNFEIPQTAGMGRSDAGTN